MSIEVIRPNAGVSNTDWGVTGAANVFSATSDNSDSTFGFGEANLAEIVLGFGTYTLQANERCLRVRGRIKASHFRSGEDLVASWNIATAGGNLASDTDTFVASPATKNGTYRTLTPNGTEWTQERIDDLRLRVITYADGSPLRGIKLYEAYIDLDVRVRPTVVVNLPTGSQSTRRPTVTWTPTIGDGQTQTAYCIRVYDLGVNASPAPRNPSEASAGASTTDGLVWSHDVLSGGGVTAVSKQIATSLGDGNFRIYVAVAKDFNGVAWWSAFDSNDISISSPPPAPTGVRPSNLSTWTTSTPTLAATVARSSIGFPALVKAEWQCATDAAFTTAVRTYTNESSSAFSGGGEQALEVPVEDALFQGTWYVRARAVDSFGTAGAWSSHNTFTISHLTGTIMNEPRDGRVIGLTSETAAFSWEYTSSWPGDAITAHRVEVQLAGDGTPIADTGKVVSDENYAVVAIDDTHVGTPLRWRVKVWDADDMESAWSGYFLFGVALTPDIAFTLADPIDNPAPLVTYSYTSTSPLTKHRVRIKDDNGTTVHDSGWVNAPAPEYQVPSAILQNESTYDIRLAARDANRLETVIDGEFDTQWTPPAFPGDATVTWADFDTLGYTTLEWTNADQDPEFFAWRVYRRYGTSPWLLLAENQDEDAGFEFRDYYLASQTDAEYAVVQVARRFGVLIESDYDPLAVPPVGTHYWLLSEEYPSTNVLLANVTSDEFSEEYEEAEFAVAERGRRMELGTRYGYRGSLSAQVWDRPGMTARQARAAIEAIRAQRAALWLRNPFGDVWYVAVGNISMSRISGVGTREFFTATIPYVEVFE